VLAAASVASGFGSDLTSARLDASERLGHSQVGIAALGHPGSGAAFCESTHNKIVRGLSFLRKGRFKLCPILLHFFGEGTDFVTVTLSRGQF
jgi:hypothetical protein